MSLRDLANHFGIATDHSDGLGQAREASDAALLSILRAMGVAIDSADEADEVAADVFKAPPPLVPPCLATRAFADTRVRVSGSPESFFSAILVREDGQRVHYEAQIGALPRDDAGFGLHLGALPMGYHHLEIVSAGRSAECSILSAPEKAYGAPDDRREWGVFAPLYALRTQAAQGVGTVAALRRIMEWAGELGASMVATLPLLAADYAITKETSPYSPISRLFWNELYLDLEPLLDKYQSRSLDALLASQSYRDECARVGALDYVDYPASSAIMTMTLSLIAAQAWQRDEALLTSYLSENAELHRYAEFRATMMRTGKTWPEWEPEQRQGRLTPRDYDEKDYRYVVFVQWALAQQLASLAAERCKLYLDLSVGASGSSYDVWRYQDDFARGVDVGAPPDGLFAGGQNWALPPLHPQRSRHSGHRYFAACVREHMRYAGMLRIDHVMGLHRLYWIPSELGATEGVYVRYADGELYAILKIESHRQQCALVGEDLGTVPENVRPAMDAAGMHRLYVAQFATQWHARENRLGLQPPDASAIASLDTHDTATFAGWFATTDLAGGAEKLMRSWLDELARSDAAALLISLEDLWLEEEPQNRPGTTSELPNWRHRMAKSEETIRSSEAIAEWLRHLCQLRS